jgi:hypothetical protein
VAIPGLESAPRYAELMYRLLGEDTEFIPPGFQLEFDDPELSFLKKELLFATTPQLSPAGAANVSFVQFQNLTTNRIFIIERAFAYGAVANRLINVLLTVTVRGASFTGPLPRDTRWYPNPPPVLTARDALTCSFGNALNLGTDQLIHQRAVDSTVATFPTDLLIPTVVLSPGAFGLVIANSNPNEALTAWIVGRSRVARPEELSP